MALKEKALRRLGEKLTAANIPFAAGGEWLRCQLGQSAVYHTFDIVVSSADAARADKVLTKLGMRQEQPAPDGVFPLPLSFRRRGCDAAGGGCDAGNERQRSRSRHEHPPADRKRVGCRRTASPIIMYGGSFYEQTG